ncbi:HAMP domain-containing protein [Herbaspirillum sp. HC18]|nr:HAMP domain-containing protein [Herbaspirillum sp. HC18]
MIIQNLKIGVRLGLGFGLVLALMLTLVATGTSRFSSIENSTSKMIEKDWVKAEAANTINATVAANAHKTMELFLAPDKTYRDKIHERIDENKKAISTALDTLDQLIYLPQGKTALSEVKAQRAQYVASFTEVGKLIEDARMDDAKKLMMEETLPRLDSLQAAVTTLAGLQKRLAQASAEDVRGATVFARSLMIVLGIAAVIAGGAVAYLITRSITRPINFAVKVAHTVAAGDLSSDIVVRSTDETGRLLRALKDMNESLSNLVHKVRHGTETVSAASAQIAAGNLDLSSRTEEQASSLEETAASMEELMSTVRQNADNAAQANALASSASEVALKGGTTVAAMVETMDGINESAKKIVDIIGLIDGIAFQTNILALNAAVEAARAGEQGRGFAVVASEVRVLAQRSAAAAKEIKVLIEDSVGKVDAGCRLVEQAGSTMDEIVVSVRRVTDIMGEIAAASTEQTSGIAQINQVIRQMDETTQQNATLVEEAAAAAASLESQAISLEQSVAVFKVNGDTAAAANDAGSLVIEAHTTRNLPAQGSTRNAHGLLRVG